MCWRSTLRARYLSTVLANGALPSRQAAAAPLNAGGFARLRASRRSESTRPAWPQDAPMQPELVAALHLTYVGLSIVCCPRCCAVVDCPRAKDPGSSPIFWVTPSLIVTLGTSVGG
ncbi:hypothetical protein MTO96_001237 [Rhipicephalus appendiculatus]